MAALFFYPGTDRLILSDLGSPGMDSTEKLIIGHRGAPGDARENTIESFEKAMASGADMIEFDVRRTQDYTLIVYHNEWIQGHFIKDLTYEAIRRIAANQGFNLPTLEEVLKWSGGKIKLDIELKEEGYEKDVVGSISGYLETDQFMITSFNDASLMAAKEQNPDIKTGLILGKEIASYHLLTRLQEIFPMRRCRKAKTDFLVAHWKLLRFGLLERAHRNHQPVFVWTVNDKEMMGRLLQDRRVYAIVTDKPDLAVSLRNELLRSP